MSKEGSSYQAKTNKHIEIHDLPFSLCGGI